MRDCLIPAMLIASIAATAAPGFVTPVTGLIRSQKTYTYNNLPPCSPCGTGVSPLWSVDLALDTFLSYESQVVPTCVGYADQSLQNIYCVEIDSGSGGGADSGGGSWYCVVVNLSTTTTINTLQETCTGYWD